MNDWAKGLELMRRFFESGATRSYEWRRDKLLRLRDAVRRYEGQIAEALYADLRKSPEEAYGTETGLVLDELITVLKDLHSWMRPRKVPTNLVNWPSRSYIRREPLGTVLVIAPWNYPFQLCLIPLIGAVAAGNVVVLKPSELAPATAAVTEKIITEVFDIREVRVVQGEGAVVVPELLRAVRFDHVFFTGSISTGRAVYCLAAEKLTPVTLELGGKSPVIVAANANLRVAARRIALGKWTNAGQTCIAPDYVLVHASVKDRLLEELCAAVAAFYGREPKESYDYGKIINARRFDQLVGYLSNGEILAGGGSDRERLYIEPTILSGVSVDDAVMKEEIFGPILPLVEYRTDEEAMDVLRANPNPLALYVFSNDAAAGRSWLDRVPSGGACINNTEWHFANPHLPFGGVGFSGMGAYHGKHSFDTFTHARSVLKTPIFFDPAVKYPPYKGKLKWLKRFLG